MNICKQLNKSCSKYIVVTEPAQIICAENVSLTERDHEQGLLATIVATTCFCNHCSHYSTVRLLG